MMIIALRTLSCIWFVFTVIHKSRRAVKNGPLLCNSDSMVNGRYENKSSCNSMQVLMKGMHNFALCRDCGGCSTICECL